jgi:hypothetical protein
MRPSVKTVLCVAGIVLLLGAAALADVVVYFDPYSQPVITGQQVNVDVVISGLGNFMPPSAGSFDLTAAFDPTLLLPTTVTFGPFLGDPNLGQALTGYQFSASEVEFAEVSLLTPEQLDALQPGMFTLATLSFTALRDGTASFSLVDGVVDDPFGHKLFIVPEPGTVALLASGLLGSYTFRRRLRR